MPFICAIAILTTASLLSLGPAKAQQTTAPCALTLTCDPVGAFLKIAETDSALAAPVDTVLAAGTYRIEATHPGYDPLAYEVNLEPGDTVALEFILLASKPEMPTAQELGLEYQLVAPLLMEDQADAVRKKYNTMAEIFLILPLSQGIMAALALGGGHDYFSGELIVIGVGLSLGSYLLGKRMASRKLDEIRTTNEMLAAQNSVAEDHNQNVDRELRRIHSEALRDWQAETTWRGRVEISD
jgi:hypothetical protein